MDEPKETQDNSSESTEETSKEETIAGPRSGDNQVPWTYY